MFELRFVGFTYFSFSSERKVPKEAPLKEKPAVFPLESFSLIMGCHGLRRERSAVYAHDTKSAELLPSVATNSVRRGRPAMGRGSKTVGLSEFVFSRKVKHYPKHHRICQNQITNHIPFIKPPSHLRRSLRDRVGRHA